MVKLFADEENGLHLFALKSTSVYSSGYDALMIATVNIKAGSSL